MSRHALVVGGTGMLRGLCLALAERGHTVTVIARRHAPLASLARAAASLPGRIAPAPADYTDDAALASAIRSATIARGQVSLAIAWVRSAAPGALPLIADLIARDRDPPRLFHICGSAVADPSRTPDRGLALLPGVRYRRVILGFVVGPPGARWLTDAEICAGVVRAVDGDASESVVGQVHPWWARPA
ncbi:MAG: hypothetical protein WD749_13545 [Phycisphaerales bacterium]